MEKSTLTFLGSDSGFGENNNSAYIETESTFTLIDCGSTIFTKIKNMFDFSMYSTIEIIVTHLHNDHAGSLSQFIMYLWYVFGKKSFVYSKCEKIEEYLNITGVPEDAYLILQERPGLQFIKTEHVKQLDSYGFLMKIDNKKIIYTGDTMTLSPFEEFLPDVSELYVDVSLNSTVHLKICDILEKLRNIKNSGTEIFLMHVDSRKKIEQIVQNEFIIK